MSWKFVSSNAQPNWQMKSKHISTMSLGEKRCKIVNGNKVSCTRRKRKKLLNFFAFPGIASKSFSRAKYESAYINMAVEEKLLQRELHENKYGYTVVEAPLFTAQKSASLIFDYAPLLIDANSLCQFGTSRRLRRCEWSEKRQSGLAREKEKVAAKLAPIDHLNSFRILCFIASAQNEKLTSTERAEKIDWWN